MGPLHGLRVVEFASIGPGPLACMMLADLGADVLRIDRTEPSGLGVPMDTRFEVNYRSRRSIALDIKQPAGRDVALNLVARADVLIEGWRPGVAERLGIGPEPCLERQPRLVYGRMTGYGQDGPLAPVAGHDINYIALAGALHAIGPADGQPVPPLNLLGDYGGGALLLAFGVLAAVYECQRSGRGQVVDAAMVDGTGTLMSIYNGLQACGRWDFDRRGANLLDGGAPFYACYETADGKYVAIGALEPKFFAELATRIGLDRRFVERQYDHRTWPEMRAAIAALIKERTRDEWCAALEDTDACVAPVLSLPEASQHHHAVARRGFVEVDGVIQAAPAPRFSRSVPAMPQPPVKPGTHTDQVLGEAGYAAAEIAALHAAGVVKGA